jgi:polyphosphate kinase 2 (PPK2 family)
MGTKNKGKTPHGAKRNDEGAKKLSRKRYEEELATLQMELVKLQTWVRRKGLRVVVIFEGRDAAGKGGVIKRITERVSPASFAPWPCRRPVIVRKRKYTSNATSTISRLQARWCSSTAAGSTGWAWSM